MKQLKFSTDYNSIVSASEAASFSSAEVPLQCFNNDNIYVLPGFADVHVHLREPGFSYKETIKTGTLAAARGGYTAVCTMPNLDPVPDCAENLKVQTDIIARDACINVYPYGSITQAEKGSALSDMPALAENVAAFSDDGRGVQSDGMMRSAMECAKSLGKLIAAHCEDNTLQGPASEWKQIERDLVLSQETGCAYHVCHISCSESVELIRDAKKSGIDVTCETAPHYLVLDDSMCMDSGRFKMNPPIRTGKDRLALIEGIADGTIDMIATDHAPHSADEKRGDFKSSLNGIVGLETAFPVLYTGLVLTGAISLTRLMELMALNPRRRFGLPFNSDDYTVFDLGNKYTIDSRTFASMGHSSPFDGNNVYGKCLMTVVGGKIAWQDNLTEN